ncbi:uncharacterized protein LOC135833123 [Planococcus citri]|uniref:uncharacterized protein LOC135833123 n=1 Tax=Planococcus citri TaxID=170843 RepID=UPI0031F9F223
MSSHPDSSAASVLPPQKLTHITTYGDSLFIKVWGVVEKDKADFLHDVINKFVPKLSKDVDPLCSSSSELKPGKLVLAVYDNQFYRAEVKKFDNNCETSKEVTVFFIDLGVITSVNVSDVRLADVIIDSFSSNKGFAEDYILNGVIASKQWNDEELKLANTLLEDCAGIGISFTGIICNRRIIEVGFCTSLIQHGLANVIADDLLCRLIYDHCDLSTCSNSQNQTSMQYIQPVDLALSYTYSSTLPVDSIHDVIISHVINGMSEFSVQLKKCVDVHLPEFMAKINKISPTLFTNEIKSGAVCLGRCAQDGKLRRAVVSNVLPEGVALYYVDFGGSEIVLFNEVYTLPIEFLPQPTMAYRFSLADSNSDHTPLTSEAHSIFTKLISQGDTLKLRVIEPLEMQQRCELFECVNVKSKVRDLLKIMKSAEYKHMSFERNQMIDVNIPYAESPLKMLIQLKKNHHILEEVMKSVEKNILHIEKSSDLARRFVVKNTAVYAPYEDDRFYRGLVIEEADVEGRIRVFYVDFGQDYLVHWSKIHFPGNDSVMNVPALATECALNIDPAIVTHQKVIDTFWDFIDCDNLSMSVKDISSSNIVYIDLINKDGLSLENLLKQSYATALAKLTPGELIYKTISEQDDEVDSSLISYVNPAYRNMLKILERTRYSFFLTSSYKQYGPPPNWNGESPGESCKVTFRGIPQNVCEDALITHFERIGQIYEFRLMIKKSGEHMGIATVVFVNEEITALVLKQLASFENIFPGIQLTRFGIKDLMRMDKLHLCNICTIEKFLPCICIIKKLKEITILKNEVRKIKKQMLNSKLKEKLEQIDEINLAKYSIHSSLIESKKNQQTASEISGIIKTSADAANSEFSLSVKTLCKLHRSLMPENEPRGEIKSADNVILGVYYKTMTTTPVSEISESLEILDMTGKALYDADSDDIHELAAASIIKLMMLMYHPFPDGNGRLSRLIFSQYLKSKDDSYPWIVFPFREKQKYFASLYVAESQEADMTPFLHYIADVVKKNLQVYLSELQTTR